MKKISYRNLILIYFSLLLLTVSLIFAYILFNNEKRSKIEILQSRLISYSEILYRFRDSVSFATEFLPEDLRITLIDTTGKVIFDNIAEETDSMENHIDRPEIIAAEKEGSGNAMRRSGTIGKDYLYYAKRFPDLYIRTSLEYNSSVKPQIRHDNIYIIILIIALCAVIISILMLSRRISQPILSLKEFIEKVQKGKGDYENIHFPSNEFGEVGEKIIQTFRQLEQAKQYKQQLTHNVAHELKTPVTSVRGYLETLLVEENISPEQRRFFLDRAYSQILRLSSLVSDISLLNNIEEASDRFASEKISIKECIKEVEDDLHFRLQEKNIKVLSEVADSTEIEGKYLLIYSLFRNLIENAIEHAGENIIITIKTLSVDSEFIYLRFSDNGKGVPTEHLERVFDRFYRVESGRSRKSGGSGLGLSIVKNAVNLHRGEISVRNGEQGGLEFDISLAIRFKKEKING